MTMPTALSFLLVFSLAAAPLQQPASGEGQSGHSHHCHGAPRTCLFGYAPGCVVTCDPPYRAQCEPAHCPFGFPKPAHCRCTTC